MLEIRFASKGKILKLHLKEGDMVKCGDPIINMEISKKKANILYRSNFTGRILSVNRNVGEAITPKDLVFTVDGKMMLESRCVVVTNHD